MKTKKHKLKQAVILCGGLGTRLGKITKKIAKPLIIIDKKKNMIDFIIKNLSRFGLDKVLLLCHYQHKKFFKRYHKKKVNGLFIECIYEKKLLGSAGSILNSKNSLDDNFLVCNGDTYFDFNILDLYNKFDDSKYLGIYALAQTFNDTSRYSTVSIAKNHILDFNFKIKKKKKIFSSGIAIFNKKILKHVKKSSSLEKQVIPSLVKQKKIQYRLYNKKFNKFIDIGILSDLNKSKRFFNKVIKKKAIIFDRDGIINIDDGYTHTIKGFKWRKKIIDLIKNFNDNNFYVFVATNQSGVGRGYYLEKDVINLHKWINYYLNIRGAHIDEFFYAPYYKYSKMRSYKKNKKLRKPDIGMFLKIISKWEINRSKSFIIGDSYSDIKFAKNAKLKGILIKPKEDVYKVTLNKIK